MSNIVPFDTAVPAHLANRVGQPSALNAAMSGGIAGESVPRISIKGGRFRVIEGGTETVLDTTTLEVVVIGANPGMSKAWYASAWNPDAEATAPDCFTFDGVNPDNESTQPQNDLCASCPHNAFGSKVTDTGIKIKACADKKRLAVVPADDPGGTMYLLEVTASALKNMNQYQKNLTQYGHSAEIARTVISFDTEASFPKLKFDFGGFLPYDIQHIVDPRFGSDEALEIIKVTGVSAPVAAPVAQVAASVAPEPTPAPVAEPVAEVVPPAGDPAPEVKTTGFGKGTTTPKEAAPTEETAPIQEAEPAPAPVADAAAISLADDITALMAEVADDA